MSDECIRILVVDDTAIYRKIVSEILADMPGVEVVGAAPNGKIALQRLEDLHPDLMTLDVEMPELDGLDVLRRLKATSSSVGAIMLSAFTDTGAKATLEALELGAFDFVAKPSSGSSEESTKILRQSLCPKIEAFGKARHIQKLLRRGKSGPSVEATDPKTGDDIQRRMDRVKGSVKTKPRVVAIGISTGGPQALGAMLPKLPADLAAPVLIVQHMPPLFTKSLADSLDAKCKLQVREAEDRDPVRPGSVLIAPGGRQMKIQMSESGLIVRITEDLPENSCRPAVDYLFRSVANTCGGEALGVIMTGMGSDGALGCRLLKRRGASIITQDEASCVVYGMPSFPADEGLSDVIAPLDRIADEIVRISGRKMAVCK